MLLKSKDVFFLFPRPKMMNYIMKMKGCHFSHKAVIIAALSISCGYWANGGETLPPPQKVEAISVTYTMPSKNRMDHQAVWDKLLAQWPDENVAMLKQYGPEGMAEWGKSIYTCLLYRVNNIHPELAAKENMALLLQTDTPVTKEAVRRGVRNYIDRDYAKLYRSIPGLDDVYFINPYRTGQYGLGSKEDHQRHVAAINGFIDDLPPLDAAKAVYNYFALAPDNPLSDRTPPEYLKALQHARHATKEHFMQISAVFDIAALRDSMMAFWAREPVASGALAAGIRDPRRPNFPQDAVIVEIYQYNRKPELERLLVNETVSDAIALLRYRAENGDAGNSPFFYLDQLMTMEKKDFTSEMLREIIEEASETKHRNALSQYNFKKNGSADDMGIQKVIERTLVERFARETKAEYAVIEDVDEKIGMKRLQALICKRIYEAYGCGAIPALDLLDYYKQALVEYPIFIDRLEAKSNITIEEIKSSVLSFWNDNPVAANFLGQHSMGLKGFRPRGRSLLSEGAGGPYQNEPAQSINK